MKKVIPIILVSVGIAVLNTSSYGGENIKRQENSTYQEIGVYFLPGTLELNVRDLDEVIKRLNTSASYRIQGYTCNDDKGSEEELLSLADRRANAVRNILVQRGFSPSKLTTIAFGKGSDCRAVVIEIAK